MNPDLAAKILNITVGNSAVFQKDLHKSFYEFDLQTTEGITSFLVILPVCSDELLMQACTEVFPGYITDEFDVKLARLELRGYFLDFLEQHTPEEMEYQEPEEVDPEDQEEEEVADVGSEVTA